MRNFICAICGTDSLSVTGGILQKYCSKDCKRKARKAQRIEFRKQNPEYDKEYYAKKYGAKQGLCCLCGSTDRKLVRDHDRSCCPEDPKRNGSNLCGNCWRGEICSQCNVALGMINDSPVVLLRMVDYLMNTENMTNEQNLVLDFDYV